MLDKHADHRIRQEQGGIAFPHMQPLTHTLDARFDRGQIHHVGCDCRRCEDTGPERLDRQVL